MDAMLALWCFLLIVGLALLVKGADFFVDGASGVAEKCGVSPLVIGLTVVAFGTSAPELAVSVASAISHSTDIAVGNVVGSNITNILLILGVSAVVKALPVQNSSLRLDLPVLLLASVLLIVLGAWGRALQWWDGLILIAVFSAYIAALFWQAKRTAKAAPPAVQAPSEAADKPAKTALGKWLRAHGGEWKVLLPLTLVGLGMVVGGGTLLVESAKRIAYDLGVPERIVGLTVVAIGTSLPELVTSVVASAKGETDIAVGNIIGSNIFNIFLVAGVASLFYPLAFSLEGNLVDALVAFAAALLLLFLALVGGKKLGRASGAVMLACFAAYYTYLFVAM